MSELFGLSMSTIMLVLVALSTITLVATIAIVARGMLMARMGLRNIRRRPAQSSLVVTGLMLATTIITAAFTTGDTIDKSVTGITFDVLQRTDISLHHFQAKDGSAVGDDFYAPDDIAQRLGNTFANDADIEGFLGLLFEPVPVLNTRTNLTEPTVILAGSDPGEMAAFGGLRFTNGRSADLASLADDEVFANARAADELNIATGDVLAIYVDGQPKNVTVAGIVREERASGALELAVGEMPGIAAKLTTVQRLTGREGLVNSVSVALHGGVEGGLPRSEAAAERLAGFIATPGASEDIGLGGSGFQVEQVKKDAIDDAKLGAAAFTTIFLVLGLFSIASGVLLIFMIFVMLAAERQREMGIARAVGALRIHLVQAFLAEGLAYALVAGIIGVALGVAFGFLVIVGGSKLAFGEDLDWISPHVTIRTLVVSFTLGWLMTFATVVVSSVLVSRLNIVAAIRGGAAGSRSESRAGWQPKWLLFAAPVLVLVPPLGLYLILHRAFGLSRRWTIGPAGLVIGATMIVGGRAIDSSFVFSTGISLFIIAAALLAGTFGLGERATWTTAGALLAAYWLMPFGVSERLFGSFDNNGMEMFVLSGIMIVSALTLVIVYNGRLLAVMYGGTSSGRRGYLVPFAIFATAAAFLVAGIALGESAGHIGAIAYLLALVVFVAGLFSVLAHRFQSLTPALRMGIAYPLANRFRTGMTIAMFSLILFSITVMSVINATFLDLFAGDDATGGWDVAVGTSRNNPIDDLPAALAATGQFDPANIAAMGGLTPIDDDRQRVRQAGEQEWMQYIVRAGDDAFWTNITAKLEGRAVGYETDEAVYEAIRSGQPLAVIEAAALSPQGIGMGDVFQLKGVDIKDHRFEPVQVEIRNEATQETVTVTIIGVFSSRIPAGLFPGLAINAPTSRTLFGEPDFRDYYLRLAPGTDSVTAAETIEAALVSNGVQALSIEKEIDDLLGASRGFLRVMQLFMALGLVVGIAAIGVISLRSVVERRQQIGMLRAIGYERSTVAWTFLFESAFVALMGVASGVIGAIVLSRNLMSSPDFTGSENLSFLVPWVEVIVFAAAAFLFALLMTWWPSRRAASVPIAEALRYE